MKRKNINNNLKAYLAILIAISFLLSVNIATSDDVEPPVISEIYVDPVVGSQDDIISVICIVTDNVGLQDVRVHITGPNGLDLNESMEDWGTGYFGYLLFGPHQIGIYTTEIWANDTSGNTANSDIYTIIIIELMDYVYVDDSNTQGPWYGTYENPFQSITIGLMAVNSGGTIIVNEGTYQESINIDKQVSLYGSGQENTKIIGEGDENHLISINHNNVDIIGFSISGSGNRGVIINQLISNITISNCKIHSNVGDGIYKLEVLPQSTYCEIIDCDIHNNSNCGIQFYGCLENSVLGCDFFNCTVGLRLGGSSDNNVVYNNNFRYNSQNAIDSGNNIWDDGIYGNYWDDYRDIYPDAEIDIINGTWETPYNLSNSQDMHPWVYPNGYIDYQDPYVEIQYPNGGEIVSSEIIVQWDAYDDHSPSLDDTIYIEYSNDSGVSWYELASNLNNTGEYTWNTKTVENGDEYLIKISATDEFENFGSDESDAVFTVFNNNPPDTPDAPSGPSTGETNIQYGFSIQAPNEPDGDKIYIKWDWGNGDITDWEGPYNSGDSINTFYSWANPGLYNIKVKAKDIHDEESGWSEPLEITITDTQPVLEIGNITGGLCRVSAEIKNSGDADAENVETKIQVVGGIFGLINKELQQNWENLPSGQMLNTNIKPIIGFGPIEITVTASADGIDEISHTKNGFVLFIYIIVK